MRLPILYRQVASYWGISLDSIHARGRLPVDLAARLLAAMQLVAPARHEDAHRGDDLLGPPGPAPHQEAGIRPADGQEARLPSRGKDGFDFLLRLAPGRRPGQHAIRRRLG